MELTPERAVRTRPDPNNVEHEPRSTQTKLKKPPPITPRRFTRFFTPRPRNSNTAIQTSRKALRAISGSVLNSRSTQTSKDKIVQTTAISTPRGKKRKLSFGSTVDSSPASRFLPSSQEVRSSPTIPERRTPIPTVFRDVDISDIDEAETDIETDDEDQEAELVPQTRIIPYRSKTVSGSLLSSRLAGRRTRIEAPNTNLWQNETANFYSSPTDVNSSFTNPVALPFTVTACHTNPVVAMGDEEGNIRIVDASAENMDGISRTLISMRPHDNALMDLEFSPDDSLLATACGDQSCQIIDMQTQRSLFSLGNHRCSVKRIAFQPGGGNNILASCGRDGQINFWDLRTNLVGTQSREYQSDDMSGTTSVDMHQVAPTHSIRDAHTAGPKSKAAAQRGRPNLVPGRADFSVTSLSFLSHSRPHLIATASEIDTTIKIWDIRASYHVNKRTPTPLACTEEPKSHEHHRRFGVTSLVTNTNGSLLYALSRDNTIYAYSTAHLILGSSDKISSSSRPSRATESHQGLGPLYGFRHPSLRVQSFWTRLAIRKETSTSTELLAVGSHEDCALLFPTNERYLTTEAMQIPHLHQAKAGVKDTSNQNRTSTSRPQLPRNTSSFIRSATSSFNSTDGSSSSDEGIKIYQHGTPLIRGHDKEVTSLAWTSEGSVITASDDYTVRCWRENPTEARRMRNQGEKNGERWRRGWAQVGVSGFDDED